MKWGDLVSALWLALSLAGAAWLSMKRGDAQGPVERRAASSVAASARYAMLPNGERGVVDANGVVVPIRHYARVASVTTVADGLVLALLEPERVAALSDYGRNHSDEPQRYGARYAIAGPAIEPLLEQHIDLVVTNHLRSQSELARTRQAGIQVFNLGDMRGLDTLLPNIAALSALLGVPERGAVYAAKLVRRLRAVAADIPPAQRKRAVYVSAYASQLFGGAEGTSYHDVLVHAGLIDAASGHYTGWVHYDPEQLIELDPELLVANAGTAEALCRVAGIADMRACANGGAGVIAIDNDLLSDPGPRMLEAAEALRDAVYGPVPQR